MEREAGKEGGVAAWLEEEDEVVRIKVFRLQLSQWLGKKMVHVFRQ